MFYAQLPNFKYTLILDLSKLQAEMYNSLGHFSRAHTNLVFFVPSNQPSFGINLTL